MGEGIFRLPNSQLQLGHAPSLRRRRRFDPRFGVALLHCPAALRHVIEIIDELVVFLLADRIVLMVVAASAADREPHPHGGGRIDAIDGVFEQEFVDRNSFLRVVAVVAIEGGRDKLLVRRLGEQVACELFDRELIERHSAIERLDDPVAPPPHFSRAVVLISVGVGITGRLQPMPRHLLAITGRV